MSDPTTRLRLDAPLAEMGLEVGREYYWKHTPGWQWFDGHEHWWEVFVRVSGFNGLGGYWLEEMWRWNGSPDVLRREVRTLSYEESEKLTHEVEQATRPTRGAS